eukprot:scaffold7052_cov254-Pinguiococcus_pyrenoidosus.AAC.63
MTWRSRCVKPPCQSAESSGCVDRKAHTSGDDGSASLVVPLCFLSAEEARVALLLAEDGSSSIFLFRRAVFLFFFLLLFSAACAVFVLLFVVFIHKAGEERFNPSVLRAACLLVGKLLAPEDLVGAQVLPDAHRHATSDELETLVGTSAERRRGQLRYARCAGDGLSRNGTGFVLRAVLFCPGVEHLDGLDAVHEHRHASGVVDALHGVEDLATSRLEVGALGQAHETSPVYHPGVFDGLSEVACRRGADVEEVHVLWHRGLGQLVLEHVSFVVEEQRRVRLLAIQQPGVARGLSSTQEVHGKLKLHLSPPRLLQQPRGDVEDVVVLFPHRHAVF